MGLDRFEKLLTSWLGAWNAKQAADVRGTTKWLYVAPIPNVERLEVSYTPVDGDELIHCRTFITTGQGVYQQPHMFTMELLSEFSGRVHAAKWMSEIASELKERYPSASVTA